MLKLRPTRNTNFMKDLKYLAAYSIPIVAFISLYLKGDFVFLTPLYGFVIIPILELIFPIDTKNITIEDRDSKLKQKVFDWLLYLNLPLVYGLVFYGIYEVTSSSIETYELVGMVISVGIVLGVNGINVAHELGHRQSYK